jgi:uncharacterized protein
LRSIRIRWVVAVAATGALATGTAAAIPPPPEQLAADCSQPTYASDQLVCATPELLALDQRMRALLDRVDLEAVAGRDPAFEQQSDWLRRRSLCAFSAAHADCLRAVYSARITELEAVAPACAAD